MNKGRQAFGWRRECAINYKIFHRIDRVFRFFMETTMDRILEILKDCNFYWGAGCGVAILFIVWCIVLLVRKCRGNCTELVIEEEGGHLVITTKAIQGFLESALAAFPGIETLNTKIRSRLGKKTLTLAVKVKPDGDMTLIRNELRPFVVNQFNTKLNILGLISDVDILISQLPSSNLMKSTQPPAASVASAPVNFGEKPADEAKVPEAENGQGEEQSVF